MAESKKTTLAPGARVQIRDEEWMVRSTKWRTPGGLHATVVGVSELVRGKEAIFLSDLDEIRELRAMPVPELVARYEAAFGKPPRTKHREHLWRRIAWKIQEQRFGGLSSTAKGRLDELIAELDVPLARQTVRGALDGEASRETQ